MTDAITDAERSFLLDHYQNMPPVAAMQLEIPPQSGAGLELCAPLVVHRNDKNCAFGGSMTSLMTLAGWGLVTLHTQRAGLDADVFVADSQVRYLAPLYSDLVAQAGLAADSDWGSFTQVLRQRGRARVGLRARVVLPDGGAAADMVARYVAIARR